MDEIVNKVANSGLITLDLGDFYVVGERVSIDISPQLYQGLVLKEKDFRQYIADTDWSAYAGKIVSVFCSVDAIIPEWAFMLLTTALVPHARFVGFGEKEEVEKSLFITQLSKLDVSSFEGQRVVVKGCGDKPVPSMAYVELVRLLQPVVKSIMFGEPCSTVPVYKKKLR